MLGKCGLSVGKCDKVRMIVMMIMMIVMSLVSGVRSGHRGGAHRLWL